MSDGEPGVQTVDRPAPTPRWQPVARSPVHHLHEKLGATFRREGAFDLPAAYGDPEGERRAIREGLAVVDVTARGKVDLRGPVDDVLARLPSAPDLLRARLSARWALLLSSPARSDACLRAAEAAAGAEGMATSATSLYAAFALAGPRVPDLLARLTAFDLGSLPAGAAAGTQLARISAILLRRDLPLPVIEVLVSSEYGRYAWETLLQAGHTLEARPVGWDALLAEGWSWASPSPEGEGRGGGAS